MDKSQSENCAKLHSFTEFEAIKKENEELKAKLTQSEAAYKNMLDRFKQSETMNWRKRHQELKDKYDKVLDDKHRLAQENSEIKQAIDSLRGSLCNIHNKLADLFEMGCDKSNIVRIDSPTPSVEQMIVSRAKMQEQQFIKYVRETISIYKSTGSLKGISKRAQKYGITALTKVLFFQYGLQNEPLTDEKIIEVYKIAKKR